MKQQPSLPTILLVEDSVDDYEAAMRSFKAAHLDNPVHWCKSGKEAWTISSTREPMRMHPVRRSPLWFCST
jgi:hypothetical protein